MKRYTFPKNSGEKIYLKCAFQAQYKRLRIRNRIFLGLPKTVVIYLVST